MQTPEATKGTLSQQAYATLSKQEGKVGYILAWLLGVPTSLLFVIFLIRGH